MIRSAEGYKFKRINGAQGDIASFDAMLKEYIKAPEVTRKRLYLETMADVLPQAGRKIVIDESLQHLTPILPNDVNLPSLNQQAATVASAAEGQE